MGAPGPDGWNQRSLQKKYEPGNTCPGLHRGAHIEII